MDFLVEIHASTLQSEDRECFQKHLRGNSLSWEVVLAIADEHEWPIAQMNGSLDIFRWVRRNQVSNKQSDKTPLDEAYNFEMIV